MAAPEDLKALLKSVNKRMDDTGKAEEGKHYLKKRKGETEAEFQKRRRVYLLKGAQRSLLKRSD